MPALFRTLRFRLVTAAFCLIAVLAYGANVAVEQSIEYQTIDGFGAHGSMDVWWSGGPFYNDAFLNLIVDDLGLTINRNEYYPKPNEPGQWPKQIGWLQALKAKADASGEPIKFIAAYWTPPYWMKNPPVCCAQGNDAYVLPEYYDDLGTYSVQTIQDYKDIGIDLYGLSLQNECNFPEPYNSCVYFHNSTTNQYRDMLKVAGPIIHATWPNVKLYGVEHMLWPQQWDSTSYEYDIINDPCANVQMGIWAVHGYGNDGMTPVPGAQEVVQWTAAWNRFGSTGRRLWMTETSGYAETWADSRQLAESIYAALRYGNISAWVWWQLGSSGEPNPFELTSAGQPTKRYYISKHYYRYVRPGAMRVSCSSNDPNVLVTAYKHLTKNTLTLVLINTADAARTINLSNSGYLVPDTLTIYRTTASENCVNVGTVVPNGSFSMPASSVVTLFGYGITATPATNPYPATNARGVTINPLLMWTPGQNAVSHDVYFGTEAPPPFIGNQSAARFDPGTLTEETGYYWRIDERNLIGIVTPGTQWRFVTGTDQGDGLVGKYYDNNDLSNRKLVRIDPDVNFVWGTSSPDPCISPDTFSVRWAGSVQPRYSESYTFYTYTDDGVRLWVDGNQIIDKWLNQNATEWSGAANLLADQKYDIEMEYYDAVGTATAQLKWSSASQAKQIIPQGRLFMVIPVGDLNNDFCVDLTDVSLFCQQWLVPGGSADFDDSNKVDFLDFALMGGNYGY